MRNLMERLRDNGFDVSGPATFNQGDRQTFAAALDTFIAKTNK